MGSSTGPSRPPAQARALAPDHWEVYYYSGLIALDRGDFDEAESYAARPWA